MRYIDLAHAEREVPGTWRAKALAALTEVRAASTKEERRKALEKHAHLWGEVKSILRKESHRKCWYCESRENRSDCAVDHFRPKGGVEGCPNHEGYWWLAFDFTNYRYSCTYCNSSRFDRVRGSRGGKQNHFPLLNPDERVFDEGDTGLERPMLLDPTRAADTILLYFREDGVPEPRHSGEKGMRAQESIEVYHLHHTDLIEARLGVLNQVRELVELGQRYYRSWLRDGSDEPAFETVIARLKKFCSEGAEYSAAVVDFIKGFRDEQHPWIDQIV